MNGRAMRGLRAEGRDGGAGCGGRRVLGQGRGGPGGQRRAPAVYRRRRAGAAVVLALLATLGGFGLATAASAVTASHGPAVRVLAPAATVPAAPAAEVHIVRPGDTLWSLVRRAHPSGDIRPLVQRLARERGRATLLVGERVILP